MVRTRDSNADEFMELVLYTIDAEQKKIYTCIEIEISDLTDKSTFLLVNELVISFINCSSNRQLG